MYFNYYVYVVWKVKIVETNVPLWEVHKFIMGPIYILGEMISHFMFPIVNTS